MAVAIAAVGIAGSQCGGRQAAGGISPASSDSPVNAEVLIKQYKYTPETLHVAVGQVVRWTNSDNVGHTVTFTAADTGPRQPITSHAQPLEPRRPTELSGSKLFRVGETWTARFDQPGRFGYICDPHPYMRAIVVVR